MTRVLATTLLCALVLMGAQPSAADDEPVNRIDRVAQELLSAWRTKDPNLAVLARRTVPDRFRVVVRLALRAKDLAERGGVLEALADRVVEQSPDLAAHARRWAAADHARIASERALLKRLDSVGTSHGGPHDGGAKPPPAMPALPDLDEMSIAVPLLHLVQAQAQRDGQEAISVGERLSRHSAQRGWHELGYSAHTLRAQGLRKAGRKGDAADAHREAARAAERAGNTSLESRALQFAYVTYRIVGRAAEVYDCLLRLEVVVGGPAISVALAQAESDLGMNAAALVRLATLRTDPELERAPASVRGGVTSVEIALLGRQGRLVEALAKADGVLSKEGLDPRGLRRARIQVASVYHRLGLLEQALDLLETVLAEPGEPARLAESSYGTAPVAAARLLHALGRSDEALARLEAAASVYAKAVKPQRFTTALATRARILHDVGRPQDALRAVEAAIERSTDYAPRQRGWFLALRAELHLAAGRVDAAHRDLTSVLDLSATLDANPIDDARIMSGLGRVAEARGDHARAGRYYGDAARLLIAASVGASDAEGLPLRRQIRELATRGIATCLKQMAAPDADPQALIARAWWFREAGHALLLAHAIERSPTQTQRAVHARAHVELAASLRELGAAQARLVRAQYSKASDVTALKTLAAELERAHAEFDAKAAPLLRAGNATQVAATRPRTLAQTTAALARGEAVLAYWTGGPQVVGFCLTPTGATVIDLGPAKALTDELTAWRELVSVPDGPAAVLGHRLYKRLVAPFAEQLSNTQRLTILPDGQLAQTPFGAFVTKAGDAKTTEYLLDRHVIAYAPSATVRSSIRRRLAARPQGKGVLAVGDAVYPATGASLPPALVARGGVPRLAPLPATRREVQAIGQLYPAAERRTLLGDEADVRGWISALGDVTCWDAIHFACHAFVDGRRPALGGLILTRGEVLSAARLAALRVPADLVVLSACDTGQGRVQAGEGVLGLSRALFGAGAAGIVMSAWRAADDAAADLMIAFHTQRRSARMDAVTALRHARLQLRKSGGPRAHPYYWAPFTVWGVSRR